MADARNCRTTGLPRVAVNYKPPGIENDKPDADEGDEVTHLSPCSTGDSRRSGTAPACALADNSSRRRSMT